MARHVERMATDWNQTTASCEGDPGETNLTTAVQSQRVWEWAFLWLVCTTEVVGQYNEAEEKVTLSHI